MNQSGLSPTTKHGIIIATIVGVGSLFIGAFLFYVVMPAAVRRNAQERENEGISRERDETTSAGSKTSTESKTEVAELTGTAGQRNALRSAKSYLELGGFSHSGLVQQLVAGDGYSDAEATYAADHVGVDWKEQAARSAKSYLEISGFSHSGLVEQELLFA